jgi:primosomal protein N' (replication factor Y)
VDRLDRDTAAGKGLREVLGRFARHEVDILVGTQMVTKGHDFPGVTLVGVLCADTGLSLPDFRASERTFQLLTQVAGRAGRGTKEGRVVVQTYVPDHAAITCARDHDFPGFFAEEVRAREELSYPPHGHLTAIRLDGEREGEVQSVAEELGRRAQRLTQVPGGSRVMVMGPAEAPLKRLKGRTRWHLWLRSTDRHTLRAFVRHLVSGVECAESRVRMSVDVDPVSAL